MFGYAGRVVADETIGRLSKQYSWDVARFIASFGCVLAAIILLAFTWNVRPKG